MTVSQMPSEDRVQFKFHEDQDLLEVIYPPLMDKAAVAEVFQYMATGQTSSTGRVIVNLSLVTQCTVTSDEIVAFAIQRAKDLGDKTVTKQFTAFYGVQDEFRDLILAWTRFFPTGGGAVEMRLFEARHDAEYWLKGRV